MRVFVALAVGATLLSAPAMAGSGHCTADLAAINAAMPKAKLSAADSQTVKDAIAKSTELQKAGKEEACEKSLASAQKILGIKDKHTH